MPTNSTPAPLIRAADHPRDEERLASDALEAMADAGEHQAQEGRFRDAVEASNVGLWDANLQTGDVYFSAAFVAMLADHRNDRAWCWMDLLHPDDRLAVHASANSLKDLGHCEQEFRIQFKSGGYRWVLRRGKVIEWDAAGLPRRAIGTLIDIDARKQAEARNRKLAAIIEASSDLIATATPDGRVDYINQAGRALLGIGKLDPLDQIRIEDYHPAWASRLVREEGIPAALAQGRWLGDSALLRRDGTEIPVSQLILAQSDPATGQAEYLSTICRDLSERFRADETLRELQREQELILDTVPALIWYKDTSNRILRVNAAVARSLDRTKEQIEGRHSTEFYPHDANRYYRDDLDVIQAGVPRLGIEEPYQLPSGERRWIRTDKVPLKDSSGRVARILVMAIDITERRNAEEALRISQDDLNRAQAVAKTGSWRLDVRHNALYWSAETYRIFGIPPGSSLNYGAFLSAVHPDDRDAVDRAWQASRAGEPYDIEHRAIVDGQIKWLREKAELELGESGEFISGFGTTQDITESKLAEEALREADRRKDEFIAILAHELRNPLAPIKNAVQILRQSGPDETTLAWSRDVIERQVDHLTQLVDDLLDISRISRGKIELQRELLAVSDIVARAVESCRPLIDARQHQLILALAPETLNVEGDLVRLSQVLSNLLNNAATYTDPGGRILLDVQREGTDVVVRVRDTGIGIAPAMLDQVFELFIQADRAHQSSHGGLGIGLSLARQLVTLHGGSITASSEGVGQGCEFVIRLPVSAERMTAATDRTPDMAGALSRHRVLVADDNVDVLESLATLLEIMGHDVRTARDGLEAVAVAAVFQPELILLDLGMPKLDGYAACQRLRAEPAGQHAVIVALSGWGQDRHKEATRAAGFDRHLVKPVSLGELQDLLEALPGDSGGST